VIRAGTALIELSAFRQRRHDQRFVQRTQSCENWTARSRVGCEGRISNPQTRLWIRRRCCVGRTARRGETKRVINSKPSSSQLRQLPIVAFGRQALALLRHLDSACLNAEELAAAPTARFDRHPAAEIITSRARTRISHRRPGTRRDRRRPIRFDDRALKAYPGAAPITRASGKARS
jgi:hypothetical protein